MSDRKKTQQDEKPEDTLDPRHMAVEDLAGARQWRRSKVGYITGAGTITDGIRSVFTNGSASKERVQSLGKAALTSQDRGGVAIWDDIEGSRERFRAAMIANGKSDADVDRSVNVTYAQFLLFGGLLVLSLLWGVGGLIFASDEFKRIGVFALIYRFFPAIPLAALTFRAGYTNWMFRNRRLEGISAYMNSGNLFARKAKPRKTSGALVRSVFAAFIIASTMAPAFLPGGAAIAQEVDAKGASEKLFSDPDADDMFVKMLTWVIPGVGPIPIGAGGVTPGTEATKTGFMVFSATLMFLAAIVSGWQILTGLVAAAKEGTVLGKQYHEVWAPVRVVIGYGMLAPVAGGMCAAQIVVLYLIIWGGNLANVVWAPYVAAVTMTDDSTVKASKAADFEKTAGYLFQGIATEAVKQVFEKELCHQTWMAYLQRMSLTSDPLVAQSPTWSTVEPNMIEKGLGMRTAQMKLDYGQYCGSIIIEQTRAYNTTDPRWAGLTPEQEWSNQMAEIRKDAIEAIRPKLTAEAQKIAQSYQDRQAANGAAFRAGGSADASILNGVRAQYAGKVLAAAIKNFNTAGSGSSPIFKQLQDLRKEAEKTGWSAAGTFYLTIARIQSSVYSGMSGGVMFTPMQSNVDEYGLMNDAPSGIIAYLWGEENKTGVIPAYRQWFDSKIADISPQISSSATQTIDTTSVFGSTLNKAFPYMVEVWEGGAVNPINAMQSMIDFGNKLMFWGTTSYVALAVLKNGAEGVGSFLGSVGGGGAVGGILKGLGSMIGGAIGDVATLGTFIALAVIAAGAVHAYVLPMIPYIMVVFFVASMLFLVVESLVAAPLWAFFHIRMDGQDFVDQVQKPGYMIAFNLILRPVLMIFGLILSFLTFGALAWFVHETFIPAMRGLSSSTGIGPIGYLVMVGMVTYIHYQLAIRSFTMILQVPDRVTRWFGQSGENLGEEHETRQATQFVVGQSSSRIEGMAKGAGASKAMSGGRRPSLPGGNSTGGGGDGPDGAPGGSGKDGSPGGGPGKPGGMSPTGEVQKITENASKHEKPRTNAARD